MGMDPFNFADSLLAVVAQRLVRRLCTQCREGRDATPAEIDEWVADHTHAFVGSAVAEPRDELLAGWTRRHAEGGRLRFHRSPGCKACDQTGFRGRAAIHEVLTVSRTTRRLIQTGARAETILEAAMTEGMRTLRQDGIEKVLAGVTTIEEVRAGTNT
jgi:type II secretory ATPase GspE/PulE/Tfp pilus assembly ATPase PilB-like protein